MGILITTAVVVASLGTGIWAQRRWPLGAADAGRRGLTSILYVLMPVPIFFLLAGSDLSLERGIGLLLGLVSLALVGAIAWFLGARLLRLPRPALGALICAVISINSAYLGYPMTIAVFGRDELPTAALFDLLVAAPAVLIGSFAVGAAFGTRAGESPGERFRAFLGRNPPLYAALAGLLAPDALAPPILVDLAQILIVTIMPLGFFAVGATLAESAGRRRRAPAAGQSSAGRSPAVALAVALRVVIAPAALLAMSWPLIDLPDTFLLIAAMPTGITAMIVAHAYGLDMEITAEAVSWSTAVVIGAALASLVL